MSGRLNHHVFCSKYFQTNKACIFYHPALMLFFSHCPGSPTAPMDTSVWHWHAEYGCIHSAVHSHIYYIEIGEYPMRNKPREWNQLGMSQK